MAIVWDVKRMWKGTATADAPQGGSTATALYDVVAKSGVVADEYNVKYAVDGSTGLAIPVTNTPYTSRGGVTRNDLLCSGIAAKDDGFGHFIVTCTYVAATGKSLAPTPSNDPLQAPVLLNITNSTFTEEMDRDFFGNRIINTAGDAHKGCKRTYYIDTVSVQRNLAAFDYSWNRTYRNTINTADITLNGYLVPATYGRIISVLPQGDISTSDPYFKVKLTVEVMDSNLPANPWQYRFIDSSANGWATDPVSGRKAGGRICWMNGQQSGRPYDGEILFNGAGLPITSTDLGVKLGLGAAPISTFQVSPEWAAIASTYAGQVAVEHVQQCYRLVYDNYARMAWGPLKTYLGV